MPRAFRAPANLSFQNFTIEEGLSDNYINHIYQDGRSYIWLSTPEGLNRFGGTNLKKFYDGTGMIIPLITIAYI